MSPNFTSSYIKDLSKKPECIKEEITEVFFYLTNEGDLLIDISKWEPRKLSMDCCHHIVNIISKDKIYNIDK